MKPTPEKNAPKTLKAEDIVFSQGHGTRKQCRAMLAAGSVEFQMPGGTWNPLGIDDDLDPLHGHLRVNGMALPWLAEIHLILHKPPGYECSRQPSHHPSVFDLLPAPWVNRGLQAAGRLDADTTGLLIFSTVGGFLHGITSPKKHQPKVYRVGHAVPLSPAALQSLAAGVLLRGETEATLPASLEPLHPFETRITIHEGRYHQVKRMFAATGSAVIALHREAIGPLVMEPGLAPGCWRLMTPSEILGLQG